MCWSRSQVQIVGGPLVHSKKNGDGYVDTPAKMQKVKKRRSDRRAVPPSCRQQTHARSSGRSRRASAQILDAVEAWLAK